MLAKGAHSGAYMKIFLIVNDSNNHTPYIVVWPITGRYAIRACTHQDMMEISSIRRIQRRPIRRIGNIVCENSGRYQAWSLLQETLIYSYRIPWIRRLWDHSIDSCLVELEVEVVSIEMCEGREVGEVKNSHGVKREVMWSEAKFCNCHEEANNLPQSEFIGEDTPIMRISEIAFGRLSASVPWPLSSL
ncbi:hypothetical protein Tco_0149739 [Tanacetum coccineum]